MASTSLAKEQKKTDRLMAALKRVRDESAGAVKTGIATGLGMGAAYGLSYYEQRFPDRAQLLGVDVSLAVGGVALVAGAMGWAGESSEYAQALGAGALSAYAAKKGAQKGAEDRSKG